MGCDKRTKIERHKTWLGTEFLKEHSSEAKTSTAERHSMKCGVSLRPISAKYLNSSNPTQSQLHEKAHRVERGVVQHERTDPFKQWWSLCLVLESRTSAPSPTSQNWCVHLEESACNPRILGACGALLDQTSTTVSDPTRHSLTFVLSQSLALSVRVWRSSRAPLGNTCSRNVDLSLSHA